MYYDKLPLRLPKGVTPYIEVVNELLLLSQSHQRKEKVFEKTTNNAPAYNRNQTSETNSYT